MFQNLLTQCLSLFILIGIGYLIRKKNIIGDREVAGLTNIVVLISMPASIISSMNIEFSRSKLFYAGIVLIISLIGYLLKYLISILFNRLFEKNNTKRSIFSMMILFSNCGFMGIPVAGALFGQEGLFYTAIVNICFNIVTWTLGIKLISEGANRGHKVSIRELIRNPGIISVLIGFSIFLIQIEFPKFIEIPLDILASTTTPLAMFSIGAFLTSTDIRSVFRDYKLIVNIIIRLIIFPIISIFILKPLGLNQNIVGVLILLEAMPVATTVAIFARQFDSDYELASKGVFLSTLVSLITIPIVLTIFNTI
ncbi:MAG: AEC family transporter [Andreesenia angusta]|nr:AEC family transporter [Andreesenia angusta]